jgi:hypothetical protein
MPALERAVGPPGLDTILAAPLRQADRTPGERWPRGPSRTGAQDSVGGQGDRGQNDRTKQPLCGKLSKMLTNVSS